MVVQQDTRERAILDLLRERYEDEGYSFFLYPSPSIVPAFLDRYQPDAIALGHDGGVVIEVKGGRAPSSEPLPEIARRFRDHDNWKFVVVYSDDFARDATLLEVASKAQIELQIEEVERLVRDGHFSAAFLLAWGALEAVARAVERNNQKKAVPPKAPRQVVEFLEREGFLEFAEGRELRSLVEVRNALVHGDLSRRIDKRQVDVLLRVLHSVLGSLEIQGGSG